MYLVVLLGPCTQIMPPRSSREAHYPPPPPSPPYPPMSTPPPCGRLNYISSRRLYMILLTKAAPREKAWIKEKTEENLNHVIIYHARENDGNAFLKRDLTCQSVWKWLQSLKCDEMRGVINQYHFLSSWYILRDFLNQYWFKTANGLYRERGWILTTQLYWDD